jgi:hypothetical protein
MALTILSLRRSFPQLFTKSASNLSIVPSVPLSSRVFYHSSKLLSSANNSYQDSSLTNPNPDAVGVTEKSVNEFFTNTKADNGADVVLSTIDKLVNYVRTGSLWSVNLSSQPILSLFIIIKLINYLTWNLMDCVLF